MRCDRPAKKRKHTKWEWHNNFIIPFSSFLLSHDDVSCDWIWGLSSWLSNCSTHYLAIAKPFVLYSSGNSFYRLVKMHFSTLSSTQTHSVSLINNVQILKSLKKRSKESHCPSSSSSASTRATINGCLLDIEK